MKNFLATKCINPLDGKMPNVNFEFSISNHSFSEKPTEKQIQKLGFDKVSGDILSLLNHACAGKPFCCGTFIDNQRKSKNFISQQVFCLDFDGKITLKKALAILQENSIQYHGGYYTYSHSKLQERFRLFFLLDFPVQSSELIKYILTGFFHLFQEKADPHCLDSSRYWNGTNQRFFLGNNASAINLFDLLNVLNPVMLSKDRNRWRSIVRTDKIHLLGNNKNLIYNYNNNHFGTDETINEEKQLIQNFDLEELYHFKILKIFLDGKGTEMKKDKLWHNELLGIATNLIYVKGGATIWKNALIKNGNYSKEKESLFYYVKHQNYKPFHFKTFSPYDDDRNNFFQTIPQLLTKRGQVIKFDDKQAHPISLEQAREKLKEIYEQIINSKSCNVYLLKAPAGIGKSSLLKNTQNAVIAFPTHSLKQEHFASSDLPEEFRLATPDIDGFTDVTKKKFESLYQSGFNDIVLTIIKNLSEGKSITEKICPEQDIEAAKKYLSRLKRARESEGITVFTTHQRALLSTFEQSTIIYDENPLSAFFQLDSVNLNELTKLISFVYMVGNKKNADILKSIKDAKHGMVIDTCLLNFEIEEIITIIKKHKIKGNILGLIKSSYFIKEGEKIHFCTNRVSQIPIDKKIVISDATAPLELYRKIFGSRLIIFEIGNVVQKGRIIQYTSYSNSKSGLKKYEQLIKDKLDDAAVITFKDKMETFENSSSEVYWGKVSGTNSLEGQNLNVVGTLHYGLPFYMFLSRYAGIGCKSFKMTYQEVTYRNLLFKFPAFDDERLQKIQLEIIESNSLQAVHRARPITYDVTIKLYSNLPIQGAEYIWWEL